MDWEELAAPWMRNESALGIAFRGILDGLMDRAALEPGETVLDVGFGTGPSLLRAAEAVGPGGRVLGVDIAPPLVALASARAPANTLVEVGDAQTYHFEPGGFDAVISQFGSMFFADPVAAFTNLRGAARPGGRMNLVTWAAPENNDWFSVSGRIAVQRLGPPEPMPPEAPGPFAFADADRVLALLAAAGWVPQVETVDLRIYPTGGPEGVAALQVDMGAAGRLIRDKGGSEADKAAIEAELVGAFAAMAKDGQVIVPAQVHFFSAVNPDG